MASLAKLVVDLEVNVNQYLSGLNEAAKKTDEFGVMAETKLAGLAASGVAGLGAAFMAVGGTAFNFAQEVKQATNDIQAGLGLTADEAQKLGLVAKDVFGNNFGESMEEVAGAIVSIQAAFNRLRVDAGENIQSAVESAFALQDVFGIDVAESADAAAALMANFGLSAQQAFDFITKGAQEGLNASDDLIDTIREYTNLFGMQGHSAEQFYSILKTGSASGILGTDKVADAFKESGIRILEMTDEIMEAYTNIGNASFGADLAAQFGQVGDFLITTQAEAEAAARALAEMGINVSVEDLLIPIQTLNEETGELTLSAQNFGTVFASQVLEGVTDGSLTIADAQALALKGLKEMENQVYANSAGVALFGTMWEDLGTQVMVAIDNTTTNLSDLEGATDSLNVKYDNLGAVFSGVWRQGLIALEPVGVVLLNLANQIAPSIINVMSLVGPAIAAAFNWILNNGPTVVPILAGIGAIIIAAVVPAFITWATVASAAGAATLVAIAPLIPPILAIGAIVAVLTAIWVNNWGDIQGKTSAVIEAIVAWFKDFQKGLALVQSWVTQAATFVVTKFEELRTGAINPIEAVRNFLMEVWEAIYSNTVGKVTEMIAHVINQFAKTHPETIGKLQAVYNDAIAIWSELSNRIKSFTSALWDNIQSRFNAGKTVLIAIVNFINIGIINAFNNLIAPVISALSRVYTSVESKFNEAKTVALAKLTELVSGIANLASSFSSKAAEIGNAIIDGLKKAISNGAASVLNALADIAKGALQAAKNALGISSPSKEFIYVAQMIISGLLHVQEFAPEFQNALVEVITIGLDKATDTALISLSRLNNAVGEGIKQVVDTFKKLRFDELTGAKDLVRSKINVQNILDDFDQSINLINLEAKFAELSAQYESTVNKANAERAIIAQLQAVEDLNTKVRQQEALVGKLPQASKEQEKALKDLYVLWEEQERLIASLPTNIGSIADAEKRLSTILKEQESLRDKLNAVAIDSQLASKLAPVGKQLQEDLAALQNKTNELAKIDPKGASAFYKLRSSQLIELAELERAALQASSGLEAERIRNKIASYKEAHALELAIFEQEQNERQAALAAEAEKFKELGEKIGQGFADSLSQGLSTIVNTIREAMQAMIGATKKELQIASPSGVFYNIGKDTQLGLINAVYDSLPAINKAGSMMGLALSNGVEADITPTFNSNHLNTRGVNNEGITMIFNLDLSNSNFSETQVRNIITEVVGEQMNSGYLRSLVTQNRS
jgi:phage-related minor tail protein